MIAVVCDVCQRVIDEDCLPAEHRHGPHFCGPECRDEHAEDGQ